MSTIHAGSMPEPIMFQLHGLKTKMIHNSLNQEQYLISIGLTGYYGQNYLEIFGLICQESCFANMKAYYVGDSDTTHRKNNVINAKIQQYQASKTVTTWPNQG